MDAAVVKNSNLDKNPVEFLTPIRDALSDGM